MISYISIPLGELMAQKRASLDPSKFTEEEFELYSVPAYDTQAPELLRGSEIGSAKKIVKPGDVLLSRIVPHIRRAWVVGSSSGRRQIGSGEWMIFNGKTVWPGYLRHLLMSDWFHPQLMQTVSGVGGSLLRARPSEVARIEIPLPHKNGKPDLDEQKRIAAILDKADAIRRKRQQALRLTDDFLRSVFLDIFGDPVTNPKGWDEVEFDELIASTKLGMVRSSEEFGWEMPVPYVRMDALTNDGRFLPEKVQGTHASRSDIDNYGLKPGDFLFNTRNSKELVGKVAVYPGPAGATFNNNLMRIRFNESADPYFVCQQFQFARVQRELEARKQGTTSVFAIYWKNLQSLPVLCPPPALQKDFRAIVDKIARTRTPMTSLTSEADDLFASLQQRAFRGEL